jgi:hypothetical protein
MTGTSLDALAGASHSCTIQVALTYSVQSLIELHIYIYIHAYIYANMCSVIIHVIQCHIICSCKGTPKNKMASLYYPLLMQGDVPYLMHLQHGVVRIPMLGTQLSTKHPATHLGQCEQDEVDYYACELKNSSPVTANLHIPGS